MNARRRNKGLTSVLIAVLVCGALGTAPMILSSAETESGEYGNQTYNDYLEHMPVNGSFEVGYEGGEVYGWQLTPTTSSLMEETENRWDKNYSLTTVVEDDGNRCAALTKNGTGYAAMTSLPIVVEGDSWYQFTYRYKTVALTVPENVSTPYYGVRAMIRQYDKEGNLLGADGTITETTSYMQILRSHIPSESLVISSEYTSAGHNFQTHENAHTVVLYIATGGHKDTKATIYLDAVNMKQQEANQVLNGNMEAVTTEALGGKAQYIDGPANWIPIETNTECTQYDHESTTSPTTYRNNYKATTALVDGDYCMKIESALDNGVTQGYVNYQSGLCEVVAGESVRLECDYKLEGTATISMKLRLWYYDADGKIIMGTAPKATTDEETGDVSYGQATATFSAALSLGSEETTAWTHMTSDSLTVPEGATYAKICIFFGGTWNSTAPTLYLDNITIAQNRACGYTEVTCDYDGTDSTSNYNTRYHLICDNNGIGHESATKLYTHTEQGLGAVIYWSERDEIYAAGEYRITYDLKISNVTSLNRGFKLFIRYYDASGNVIYADQSGEEASAPYAVSKYMGTDQDWTTASADFTVPDTAKYISYGLQFAAAGQKNSGLAAWWDHIVIKPVADAYWESDAYLKKAETDLFFVMLQEGNAYTAEGEDAGLVDVRDLVRMKKGVADETQIAAENFSSADMDKNTKINDSDMTLLRWKLLGITTTAELNNIR